MTSEVKIAVLLPCYNEGLTIKKVIEDFRRELPTAAIYVYDNNSTDNSALIASEAGAVVRRVRQQGKGFVVRRMFREIEADVYVMVDADDTYLAEDAPKMIELIQKENFDMVIGDRLNSTYFEENKRFGHNFGNKLVRKSINKLFHSKINSDCKSSAFFNFIGIVFLRPIV